jgi:trans-aconitate 2-methyltransferase
MAWDPRLYLRYADERGRPFVELLARVGAEAPGRVVDLGCGPGNLTRLLKARWPDAEVVGVDSSPEMVAAAPSGDVRFEVGSIQSWTGQADVVVSNAALQWVPGHLDLLPAWLAALPSRAWFALQVPGNFGAPSHELVRELAAGRVTLRGEAAVPEPDAYAEVLAGCGVDVDVWETTYHQRLTGPDPVLHWIGATALRPVRDALPPDEYEAFVAELAPRLRAAYPARLDGTTWFPFRRIFAVARTA